MIDDFGNIGHAERISRNGLSVDFEEAVTQCGLASNRSELYQIAR